MTVTALIVLAIAVSWAYEAIDGHGAAVARAERDIANARRGLVEHTARTFEAASRALEAAVELRKNAEAGLIPDTAVHDMLKAIHGGSPVLQSLSWTDAAGERIRSSRFREPPPLNLRGRDGFEVHAATPDAGLYVGAPMRSRVDGAEILLISRRAVDRDGRFAGIVSGVVLLDYFRQFYRSLDLGPEHSLLLVRDDGAVLVRDPPPPAEAPTSMADTPWFRERLSRAESGSYRTVSVLDGVERFVSYGRVPGFPLVIGTAVSARDVFADYRGRLAASTLRTGLTLAAVVVACLLLMRLARRRQEAMRDSLFLASIVETSNDAIITKRLDGTIVSWNAAASRMFGFAADETVGRAIDLIIPADRMDEEAGIVEMVSRGEVLTNRETVRRRKDGAAVEVSITVSPLRDAAGAVTGTSTIARDITERKRRELETEGQARQLAENTALLESVFRTMGQGVAVYDRGFRLVACNDHLRTMDGGGGVHLQPAARLEDRLRHFAERGEFGGDEDPEAIVSRRMATARAGTPGSYERHRADGTIIDVQWAPMSNGFHVIIHTDVTEQKRAEAALRASEERFRDFALSSADWYWEQDENLRFTYVSSSTAKVSSMPPEANLGRSRRETAKLGVTEQEWEAHDAILAARRPLRDFRYQRIGPDGRLRHLSVSGVPVLDEAGRFRGYRGTGRDITREVESAAMLRAVVDAIPAMINAKDRRSRYVLMNSYQASIYGTTPAEAVGKNASELLGERYGGYTAELDRRVIETGLASDSYEEAYAGADGIERHWLTAKRPLRNSRGDVEFVITVAVDIGKLKETEARLRAVEAELRASEARAAMAHARLSDAIGSMSDGFILWDDEDRLVLRNDAAIGEDPDMAMRLVPGVTFREVIEQRVMAGYVPAAIGQEAEYVERRLALHRSPPAQPYVFQLKDGRWMSLRERRTQEGGVVAIRSDVTQLKQREAELAAAREAAEEANCAKSEFLSRMSHELRTPLNAVIGFAQMLELDRSKTLTALQKEYCNHIEQGGRHLLSIVNDILDLSRVESGNLKMSVERVSVADALEGLRDTLLPLAGKAAIALEVTDAATVPDIRADELRLRQVLINLASNAIKYNRPGGSVFLSAMSTPGGRVRFIVMDTGIGIPPEQQAAIFTPFNRGGAEHTAIEGTGIGLAITKRLVESMNGTIGFSSSTDQGSTFWVELPIDDTAPETLPVTGEPAATPQSRATAGGYSLLYVEDNPVNLRLMEHLVSTLPNVVMLSAATPRLGIDLAVAHQPDVIVLDLNMPEMSGAEMLARLKAMPETRAIPVLALTAAAMPSDVSRGVAAGFFRYLTKPLDVKAFLAAVDAALARGGARMPATA